MYDWKMISVRRLPASSYALYLNEADTRQLGVKEPLHHPM